MNGGCCLHLEARQSDSNDVLKVQKKRVHVHEHTRVYNKQKTRLPHVNSTELHDDHVVTGALEHLAVPNTQLTLLHIAGNAHVSVRM